MATYVVFGGDWAGELALAVGGAYEADGAFLLWAGRERGGEGNGETRQS